MSPKLTIFHYPPSAPSRAALLTLRNLNLEFEIKLVNLINKEQLNKDFIKINPQHVIPTIVDDDFVLWESRAISQYLIEMWSPNSTLIPKNLEQRAIMNQRLYFDLGTLYTRIRAIGYPILFMGETTISQDKKEKLYEAFELMEIFLQDQSWFVGNTMTIADLSILASLSSIIHVGIGITQYKNLSGWYERCRSIPGFKENEIGAKEYGQMVRRKIKDTL